MTIKIKQIAGYDLNYDERSRQFTITDTGGIELSSANTQDEAEEKAKVLSNRDFKRIRIIRIHDDGKATMGELTSLNKDSKEAWVSLEKDKKDWGSGREKIYLTVSPRGFYEATETNIKILESIRTKREALDKVRAEIDTLIGTLEKPITLDYFGINK